MIAVGSIVQIKSDGELEALADLIETDYFDNVRRLRDANPRGFVVVAMSSEPSKYGYSYTIRPFLGEPVTEAVDEDTLVRVGNSKYPSNYRLQHA